MQSLLKSEEQQFSIYDGNNESSSIKISGNFEPMAIGLQASVNNDYIIYLRLRTAGFTLKKARNTKPGGDWTDFYPMPWVRQNCFDDCSTCFDNGHFTQIMSTGCTSSSFTLELHFQNDNNPKQWGKTSHSIEPSCSLPGQVECVG